MLKKVAKAEILQDLAGRLEAAFTTARAFGDVKAMEGLCSALLRSEALMTPGVMSCSP